MLTSKERRLFFASWRYGRAIFGRGVAAFITVDWLQYCPEAVLMTWGRGLSRRVSLDVSATKQEASLWQVTWLRKELFPTSVWQYPWKGAAKQPTSRQRLPYSQEGRTLEYWHVSKVNGNGPLYEAVCKFCTAKRVQKVRFGDKSTKDKGADERKIRLGRFFFQDRKTFVAPPL